MEDKKKWSGHHALIDWPGNTINDLWYTANSCFKSAATYLKR